MSESNVKISIHRGSPFADFWRQNSNHWLALTRRGCGLSVNGLCWGFEPATEIPTPPSDHIPLRRRCSFGGSIPHQTPPSCGGKGRGRWRRVCSNAHLGGCSRRHG